MADKYIEDKFKQQLSQINKDIFRQRRGLIAIFLEDMVTAHILELLADEKFAKLFEQKAYSNDNCKTCAIELADYINMEMT